MGLLFACGQQSGATTQTDHGNKHPLFVHTFVYVRVARPVLYMSELWVWFWVTQDGQVLHMGCEINDRPWLVSCRLPGPVGKSWLACLLRQCHAAGEAAASGLNIPMPHA